MPFVDVTDTILTEEAKELEEAYKNNPKVKLAIDQFEAECKLRRDLADARRKNNISQTQLTKLTGLTQQTISRIETNSEINPSLRNLLKYITAMGYELKLVKK
ncbi:MAG: helix-turn-helix domain-containing protein [Oscillospiraceae bacterium]|nr:helix-turn-helix domain-containing protein [Oscillospiraceae bacterium]